MSNIFFYEPFYDIERLFDEALGPTRNLTNANGQVQQRAVNAPGEGAVRQIKPRMDLHEDSENNLVVASFELPGLVKDNVQIDVHGSRLTVSAESKQSEKYEEGGYAVRERRYGKISRTLQLPVGVKTEEIKASMEHGVLTVTFPKAAPEAAPQKIEVK